MLSVDDEELPSEEEALQATIQRNLEFSLYRNQRVEQLFNILKPQLPPQALYDTQLHYKIEVSKTRFRFDNEAEFDWTYIYFLNEKFKKTQGKATRPSSWKGSNIQCWLSLQKLLVCCPENLPPQYYETFENYEEEVFMMAIDNELLANSLTLMNSNHYQDMITTLEPILYENY
ncbi:932_t:CDS:2, partial [Scutellospora calospora]